MRLVRISLVGLLVALSACGASASRVTGPDGSFNWYAITCRRNRANCIEKAGEVCPGGYRIADTDDREGVYADSNAYGSTVTTTYHGEMLIKCKVEPAR